MGPAPAAGPSGRDEVLLGLLAALVLTVNLDTRAVVPLLPAMARDLGESVAATGLIVTAYGVPFAVFQLGYGPVGDRVGRLRVIAAAYTLFVLGTGLSALAPSLPALMLIRGLTGAAAAAVYPLALAHVGDTVPYAQRQAAIGVLLSIASAAFVLSFSIGGILGEVLSWRALYGLFALMALAAWLMLLRAVRRTRPAAPPGGASDDIPQAGVVPGLVGRYTRVLRLAEVRVLVAMVFTEGLLLMGGLSYLGAALHDRFGVSVLVVGLLLTGFGVGMFGTARASGWMVRRLGERRQVLLGGLLMSAGFLFAEVMPVWPLGVGATLLMGAGFGAAHTTLQTRMTEAAPHARGTALAMHAFGLSLGQALGAAALGGLLALTGGYDALLLLAAAGLALFAVFGSAHLPARAR